MLIINLITMLINLIMLIMTIDQYVHRAHDDDQAGSSINLTCVVNHLPERQVIRWKHKVNHQYDDLDHDDYDEAERP